MTKRRRPTGSKPARLTAVLLALTLLASCGSGADTRRQPDDIAAAVTGTQADHSEEPEQNSSEDDSLPDSSSEQEASSVTEEKSVSSVKDDSSGTTASEDKPKTAKNSPQDKDKAKAKAKDSSSGDGKPKDSSSSEKADKASDKKGGSSGSSSGNDTDNDKDKDKDNKKNKQDDTSSGNDDSDSGSDTDTEQQADEDIPDLDSAAADGEKTLDAPETPYSARYFLKDAPEEIRKSYRRIFEGIFNCQRDIVLPDKAVKESEISDLLNLTLCTGSVLGEAKPSYDAFLDSDRYVTKIRLTYRQPFDKSKDMYEQMNARADSIVSQAASLLNDYEKVKFFHDTIIKGCTYDESASDSHTAYGALCAGKAVCEGYSRALMVLCDKAGIPCLPYSGSASGESGKLPSHVRNMVRCGGEWFVLDLTWDDPGSDSEAVRYDYFMIDDEASRRSQTPAENRYITMPQATNAYGDYFTKNGLVVRGDGDSDLTEQLTALVSTHISDGWSEFDMDFRCADKNTYDRVLNEFFGDDSAERGFGALMAQYLQPGDGLHYSLSASESVYVYHVYVSRN